MDQNVYADRVDENHIKVTAGNVELHFTPEDSKELLLDSGNHIYGNSVVIIKEDIIEIVPDWGSSWSNGLTEPFYRIMFNKKQFQDEIRKALDPPKSIKINSENLKVGDIILHSNVPHKILTKDIIWSKDHERKRLCGEVMNLTTGENVPYHFTWSYSPTKLPVFTETDNWSVGDSTKNTTIAEYVWLNNDEKFVVSVN